MKNSVKTAFSGVFAALAVVCMLLSAIIPIASYSCVLLASFCIAFAAAETDAQLSVCVYIVAAVLSVLLVPDKESVVLFVSFFGYYPILKNWLDTKKSRLFRTAIKAVTFNLSCILTFIITVNFFGVPKDSYTIFGFYLPWVFLIMANIIFIKYDKALKGVVILFTKRFKKYIFK